MNASVQAAAAITRTWVRLYTARLPESLRDSRRAEMDADLWEHHHDGLASRTTAWVTATQIVLRTSLGAFDDLAWRFEVVRVMHRGPNNGRIPMLHFTNRQTRWMGLAGLTGGLLWGFYFLSLMQRSRTDFPAPLDRVVPLVVAALLLTGLVGFLTAFREQIGRKGAIGVSLLIVSMASYLLANTGLLHDTFLVVLGVGGLFLPIPGFILIGFALKGAARAGAFLVAFAGPVGMALWSMAQQGILSSRWFWLREDAPVNLTYGLYFILAAAWLAIAGYSTYRQAQRLA